MDTKKLLLIFIPAILFLLLGLNFRIKQYAPSNKKNTEKTAEKTPELIPLLAEDPVSGDRRAPVTVIAFEDLACSGCKIQSELLEQVMKAHPGKVKIIWKLLNVTTFPHNTELAHAYAYCAHEQEKFTEFKNAAFANASNLSESVLKTIATNEQINQKKLALCIESGRAKEYQEKTALIAKMFNIQAVPALFVNNKQIQTPGTIEEWEALLQL